MQVVATAFAAFAYQQFKSRRPSRRVGVPKTPFKNRQHSWIPPPGGKAPSPPTCQFNYSVDRSLNQWRVQLTRQPFHETIKNTFKPQILPACAIDDLLEETSYKCEAIVASAEWWPANSELAITSMSLLWAQKMSIADLNKCITLWLAVRTNVF